LDHHHFKLLHVPDLYQNSCQWPVAQQHTCSNAVLSWLAVILPASPPPIPTISCALSTMSVSASKTLTGSLPLYPESTIHKLAGLHLIGHLQARRFGQVRQHHASNAQMTRIAQLPTVHQSVPAYPAYPHFWMEIRTDMQVRGLSMICGQDVRVGMVT
jgi:hypothetical protein